LKNRNHHFGEAEAGIDRIQFEQVFQEHYEPIRNYIYYKSGDINEAEDITQEAFLKIWEKRDTIISGSVKSLLYTISGNIFINRRQHRQVELRFALASKREETVASPEFDMEMNEFSEKLQNTLAELSEKNRTVFLMNRIDRITYRDIATALDISVKAVEKRMSNALAFLNERLEIKI
jgi:RNA polymerase sigma-70 factor (family 1)